MNERAVNCYQKEQPRRLRHSTGNSSPAPVPVWHTWKMISLLCLSPALLNLQFLPLFMINETAESWISACTDNTKHCQTPPDWHWAFSCPAGIKTSALYVSNWLSALKKSSSCSVVGQNISLGGGDQLFVRVHNFLWSPLFVSIILPTQMAGKQFVSTPAWTASMKNPFKEKKKSGFSQDPGCLVHGASSIFNYCTVSWVVPLFGVARFQLSTK